MPKNLDPILSDGRTIYDDEDWGDNEEEEKGGGGGTAGVEEFEEFEEFASAEENHATSEKTNKATSEKPEIKHLSQQEKKNIIIGLAILLAVGTAVVRFITY